MATRPPPIPRSYSANKRLGQHFLNDPEAIGQIEFAAARLLDTAPQTGALIEIGAGPGVITAPLWQLADKAGIPFVAIDIDPRSAAALKELNPHISVVVGDALQVPPWQLQPNCAPYMVVGNLPYNVATPLLMQWFPRFDQFAGILVMLQADVAARLLAPARLAGRADEDDLLGVAPSPARVEGKEPSGAFARLMAQSRSRLSVLAQANWQWALVAEVAPTAFDPPPKVQSAVVCATPIGASAMAVAAWQRLADTTAHGFGQRRQMLRKRFSSEQLAMAGVAPTARPEELTLRQWQTIAQTNDQPIETTGA